MDPEQYKKLRTPFPPEQIEKLPKGGRMLDYVGHAAVTARLLEVDPEWNWEPVAFTDTGLPRFSCDANGHLVGLWIRLTVCGVTRLGFGSVAPGAFDAEKQLIGDALRNAAMRFGVALDLWAKADLLGDYSGVAQSDERGAPKARNAGSSPAPGTNSPRAVNRETGEITAPEPEWKPQLGKLLKDAGLKMADLAPVIGAPITQANYVKAISYWLGVQETDVFDLVGRALEMKGAAHDTAAKAAMGVA